MSAQNLKRATFRSIELFRGLAESELDRLAAAAVARSYGPGETVFLEGEPCQGIHFVASGSVKILKTTPSGRQLVLAVQQAPATVAEVPVFDGGTYPATVVTVASAEVLLVTTTEFQGLCKRNPEVTLRFLAVFGRRLRTLVNLVERVTFGSVRQRLAETLLEMAAAAGAARFTMPETQEQLAARLGTVREVVSRNLSRFQAEGMLRLDRREVEIVDRTALETEASTEM